MVTHEISQQLTDANICAVIAPDEKFGELAAKIAKHLGIVHNPSSALRKSTNKYLSRLALQSAGLSIPEFRLIQLDENLDRQIKGLQFPCVAKPLNLSASRGVIRANNELELNQAVSRISALLRNESGLDQTNQVLVENYVGGTEHALEAYLSDSNLERICIFDKPDPLVGPFFEETYYITPSRLDPSVQQKIQELILKSCLYFGLKVGPIHAEVRVEKDAIWILEVAARSIGGDCARLFELATDCALEEYILRRTVNENVESLNLESAAGVLMIPVSANGILRRIEGVTRAQTIENILEVRLDVRTGDRMIRWPEGGKYPGFIYAKARHPELVEASLRKAFSYLNFVCTPNFPVKVH